MKKHLTNKDFSHYGVYGILINNKKILLIKKNGGPYNGKLDLPGGTIEFHERPEETLKREFREEVRIDVISFELIDADSVNFKWNYENYSLNGHHVGIFYNIIDYKGNIKQEIAIDKNNDDSNGAEFYDISHLKKEDLSLIAILELEKMGYKL